MEIHDQLATFWDIKRRDIWQRVAAGWWFSLEKEKKYKKWQHLENVLHQMGVYLIKSQVKSASPWPVPSCLWQIRPLQLPPVPQSCSAERSTDERGLPLCDLLPTHITQSVISWPQPEGNVGLEHIQAHTAIIPVMSHYCPATPVATRINLWLSSFHCDVRQWGQQANRGSNQALL